MSPRVRWRISRCKALSEAPAVPPDALREERLSRYWQSRRESDQRLRFVLRHPMRTARATFDILCSPRLPVVLTDSDDGISLREHLQRRVLVGLSLGFIGACVLSIPADPAEYSVGRHRQTLRRKIRAGQKAGVVARRVDDPVERRRLVGLLNEALPEKSDHRYRLHGIDHMHLVQTGVWMAAYSDGGEPLVVSVTPFDGEWALLQRFISLGESPMHSDARYVLTQAVVQVLGSHGVRHLFDTASPYELTNGLRHFQRMIGFRLLRVRVAGTSVATTPTTPRQLVRSGD